MLFESQRINDSYTECSNGTINNKRKRNKPTRYVEQYIY